MESKIYKAMNKASGQAYLVEAKTLQGARNRVAEQEFTIEQATAKDVLSAPAGTIKLLTSE